MSVLSEFKIKCDFCDAVFMVFGRHSIDDARWEARRIGWGSVGLVHSLKLRHKDRHDLCPTCLNDENSQGGV